MEYQAIHHIPWQHGSFWVFVAIAVFAVLFARRIAAPVAGMLDNRASAVRIALDEAARLKAEAEAMLADARARQEQAERDASDIIAAAHDEAGRLADDLRREAEAAATWRERLAMDRINAAEHAAVTEIRGAAIDVAHQATTATLRDSFGTQEDAGLIDRAIGGLSAALRR